jgi:hypothetical protein
MKKLLLSCALILSLYSITQAQRYNFAGGIRLGTEYGFTLKYRVADKLTVEGILQSPIRDKVAVATLLVEKHNSILTKGLNIYVGGGLQKGWVLDEQLPFEDPFGIAGIIGAEFNFARLNLSYDIKPAVNIVGGASRVELQTGISVRYIFSKDKLFEVDPKKREKRKRKRQKAKNKRKSFKEKMKDRYQKKKN